MTVTKQTASALTKRFGVSGLRFETGKDGAPIAEIDTKLCRGSVSAHGAHVMSYQPVGEKPVIWMSDKSWFEPMKPIRGGVPVCWPWFGGRKDAPDMPSHGFARLLPWTFTAATVSAEGEARLSLESRDNATTRRYWPNVFVLKMDITFGKTLSMDLTTHNVGDATFTIEQALHTYFAVSDIRKVTVAGLEKREYLDTVADVRGKSATPIAFTEETDRVYFATSDICRIQDPGLGRVILNEKRNSLTTVVWNPWTAKAQRMPDFGDDEFYGMVCVETCNIENDRIILKPGEHTTLGATIRVASIA